MTEHVKIRGGYSGEYRYRLTGPNGEIKDECDWKPNMLLNNGLNLIRTTSITTHMAVGSSNAAPDVGQNYLQGSWMGVNNYLSIVSNLPVAVAPNWEKWKIKEGVFPPGVATGTIGEFILGSVYNMDVAGCAAIRVALDTPIVKGALDQLTIQHKFTLWPETGDVDQVIQISGVDYNVKMRAYNGYNTANSNDTLQFGPSNTWYIWANATIPAGLGVNGNNPGTLLKSGLSNSTITYGEDAPNEYWTNCEAVWDIDAFNGEANLIYLSIVPDVPPIAARITKVSDGSGIVKPNTHELTLNFRLYPIRYVP